MLRPAIIFLILLCACCSPAPQVRRYAFHGKVVSVDVPNKTANITNDKIEGWMESMSMDYPVPDPQKLHAGAEFNATIVVSDSGYHFENIKSP